MIFSRKGTKHIYVAAAPEEGWIFIHCNGMNLRGVCKTFFSYLILGSEGSWREPRVSFGLFCGACVIG